MMMLIPNERTPEPWRCCLCCHVRTGAIAWGIWHLIIQVLTLAVIAVILFHPEVIERMNEEEGGKLDPMLPTPLSNEVLEIASNDFELRLLSTGEERNRASTERLFRTDSYLCGDAIGKRRLNCQDLNAGLVVTLSTLAITLLMLYGAIKGRPIYLMPFFCLQVIDFGISSLSMVGYFTYPPDFHQLIANNPNLPYQKKLMNMDQQMIGLIVMAFIVVLAIKWYFIRVVWNCYKFLTLGRRTQRGCVHYIEAEGQRDVPQRDISRLDLPDYETAVNDPAYAKKEAMLLPPPYSSVTFLQPHVSLPPETSATNTEETKPNPAPQLQL